LPKLVLTEEARSSLKVPLGRLLLGEGSLIYNEIARLISVKRPPRVIFVGDAVSRNATVTRIRRDLMIIDNREMRAETESFDTSSERTFRVRNEPGTICMEAWAAVEDAVESGNAVVIVDGEEDLLTLVAMTVAPLGSFVIYGQPDKGVVLVEIDEEARKKAKVLVQGMTRSD